MRCGVMGPLLQTVFEEVLSMKGYNVRPRSTGPDDKTEKTARVGLISHIGGHKFAGNVIIYMPSIGPEDALQPGIDPGKESLFGKGVWYGRVEPRHVEGLVEETIMKGRVVEELCRGVVGGEGELFRP
jgi:Sucrase/ferredoxin-like